MNDKLKTTLILLRSYVVAMTLLSACPKGSQTIRPYFQT